MDKKQARGIIKYFFIPILLILSLLYGCVPPAPVCVKDGLHYCRADGNFTYEWYDYYERGLSCMEGGCYEDALADFDTAVGKRPDDKWMARTFGMHLKDYFPHREKGLIYYKLGEYGKALEELEISLTYQKSSKAFYYRDKVREALMKERGENIRVPGFVLPSEIWSKDNPVKISGIAESTQYVSEITVGDKKAFVESSEQTVFFEETLSLNQGGHEIEIMARNLLGGLARHKMIVHADRSGPVIAVETADPKQGLKGCLYDESGEISLLVNGKKVPVSDKNEFFLPFPEGAETFTLIAEDRLGNQTGALLNPEITDRHSAGLSAQYPILATDGIPNRRGSPPEIMLAKLSNQDRVFDEMLSIEGQVRGKTALKEVFINETAVHKKPGLIIFFNHSEPLKEGENRIFIRAKDESETESLRELIVIRQIPEIFKLQYRCMFKTIPFDIYPREAEDQAKGTLFQYLFLENLVSRKRFRVRIPEELEKLMDMQHLDSKRILSGSDEMNPRPFMLSGTMYDTKEGVEAVTKVVNIGTGEILDIIDGYTESKIRPGLESVAGILAEKFHRAFPLIKGKIVQKEGECFLADMDGDIRMQWLLGVGTNTAFSGYASISEKMKHRKYRIRLRDTSSDTGDRVVTQ